MSESTAPNSGADDDPDNVYGVEREEIPTRVYETLVDEFGANQDRRARACFISQSLREVMKFLNPQQVIEIEASRHPNRTTQKIPLSGPFAEYTDVRTVNKTAVDQKFDRKPHKRFAWEPFKQWLDDNEEIHDLAVSKLVFRIDNDSLREQLLTVLQEAIGFKDAGEFKGPFFAVMESKPPGEPKIRRAVSDYHDSRYFTTSTEDADRGMGWRKRTLDLTSLWSYRAFTKSKNQVFYDMNMREVEDLAINHIGTAKQEYGAINSPLVLNKWRQAFSRGTTMTKHWNWQHQQGWVRVGEDDEE